MKKTVAPLQDTQEKKQNKNGVGKKNHQTENQNYQARGSLNLTR